MPAFSIVIVSYNTCQLLLDCLSSLERLRAEADFEILVVDNASPDGTPSRVREHFSWVNLIEMGNNRGFATALNAGIRAAIADVIFALNPDCLVPCGSLAKLNVILKNNKNLGVVGCQLVSMAGDRQTSSFRFPSLFREFWNFVPEAKSLFIKFVPRFLPGSPIKKSLNESTQIADLWQVSAVSGAAFLVSKTLWKQLGGFDERFFLYHEELDFCTRASKAGHKVELTEIPIIHHDAQASGYRTGRFPSMPVLGWRLSGMNLLWSTHCSTTAHRGWQVLAMTMLRIRIWSVFLAGQFSRRSSQERRKRLQELSEALEIVALPPGHRPKPTENNLDS